MGNENFLEFLKFMQKAFLSVEEEYKKLSASENDIQNYSRNAIFELFKFKYNNLHSFLKVCGSVFFNFQEEEIIKTLANDDLRKGFETIKDLYDLINDDGYHTDSDTVERQINLAIYSFSSAKSSYLKNAKPHDNLTTENLHSIIKYILSGFKDDEYFVVFNKLFIASLMETYCYKLVTIKSDKKTIVDKKFNEVECYFYLRLFYNHNSVNLNSLKKKIVDESLEYTIFNDNSDCSIVERIYKNLQDQEEIFIKIAKDIFNKEIVKTFSGNPKCTKERIDNPKSSRAFAAITISYATFNWLPEIFKTDFPAI